MLNFSFLHTLAACVVCLLTLGSSVCSFADGLPYNAETQEIYLDTVRIRLSPEQTKQIATTGKVTLQKSQHELVRKFYPNALAEHRPIWPTYNDNVEGLDGTEVYVIWSAPGELAVTISAWAPQTHKHVLRALSEKEVYRKSDDTTLLIGPEGEMALAGKAIKMEAVKQVVGTDKLIYFKVAPGYDREKVNPIIEALYAHAKARKAYVEWAW